MDDAAAVAATSEDRDRDQHADTDAADGASASSSKRSVDMVLDSLDSIKNLLENMLCTQTAIKNLLEERLPKRQKVQQSESESEQYIPPSPSEWEALAQADWTELWDCDCESKKMHLCWTAAALHSVNFEHIVDVVDRVFDMLHY